MVGKISGVGRDRLIASGRFSLDGLAQNIALKPHFGARLQDLILCAGRELVTHPKMHSERDLAYQDSTCPVTAAGSTGRCNTL
jgi:hypothetical protein